MMAQDIADDELASVGPRAVDHAARIFDRRCKRLFHEHMRTLLHRGDGIIRMAFRIGGDAGEIGLQFL